MIRLKTIRFLQAWVVFLMLLFVNKSYAQVLGQDKEGYSSIIIPSANINIDGASNVISISFSQLVKLSNEKNGDESNDAQVSTKGSVESNNDCKQELRESECFNLDKSSSNNDCLKKCLENVWNIEESNYNKNNKSLLYGVELNGSSKNGLAIIFDDELLANSAIANGIVGVYWKKLKRKRRNLDKYVNEKKLKGKFFAELEERTKTFEILVRKYQEEGFLSENYKNKLLGFNALPKREDQLLEIEARIQALKDNAELEFDIVPRTDEIVSQLDFANSLSIIVKSVMNGYRLPNLGNIDNASELRKILSSSGLPNLNELTDEEIVEFGKNLKKNIFPKLKEMVFNDIPGFKFFLSENSYPNIQEFTNTELSELRSLFKKYVFYSDKELGNSNVKDSKLANEKLIALNTAKESFLNKMGEYEKEHPSSKKFNNIKFSFDLAKHTEEATWTTAEKGLLKLIGVLKSRKLQIEEIGDKGLEKGKANEIENQLKELKKLLSNYIDNRKERRIVDEKQVHFNRSLIYGKVGFVGRSFLYDFDNGNSAINERIMKRSFRGNRFELGSTFQFSTFNFFGLSISREYTDNSNLLTSTTYKVSSMDDTVSPVLESSSEITALSGPYDLFDQYRISADYVHLIRFKKKENQGDEQGFNNELFLSLNPYLRHNFYGNSTSLKPNTSLGLGLHAFNVKKNSIAGGVFVQANDIFDINSTANFDEKINIGLVFKYSLKSFSPDSK